MHVQISLFDSLVIFALLDETFFGKCSAFVTLLFMDSPDTKELLQMLFCLYQHLLLIRVKSDL